MTETTPGEQAQRRRTLIRGAILLFLLAGAGQLALEAALLLVVQVGDTAFADIAAVVAPAKFVAIGVTLTALALGSVGLFVSGAFDRGASRAD